jgi:hypothetical protein
VRARERERERERERDDWRGRHQMYPVDVKVAPHSVNSNSLESLNGAQRASE